MIKVSDYLVERLVEHGVKDIFMVTGGGAMHINDSVGKCLNVNYICNHHEQACAIAAEGYSRVKGKLAVVSVTTGPGGTNALTGVIGQWLDSVPVLYISGQVKMETTISAYGIEGLRQIGDQEINIIDIVKPVTKFAEMITDPKDIKRLIDKAIFIATSGRPGPVWLDIPLNIQGALVDEATLREYDKEEDIENYDIEANISKIQRVAKLLANAKRPIFVAGNGIRISKAEKEFMEFCEQIGIPVVSTFNGYDLISTDHPLFIGRIGTVGNRPGNFALQNADLLITVGSRNNIRQISYDWKSYAKKAIKVVVDIDKAELKKPTLIPDIAINCDAKYFLQELKEQITKENMPSYAPWREWCIERKNKYTVVLPEYLKREKLNPYLFIDILCKALSKDNIIVAGNGTACVALFQAGIVKKGQRAIWNSGCASMGYDLPAAIGASFAARDKDIICLAGDGSLQMNIQELQTMVHNNLPIKLFVLNNNGYISIRQTQDSYFESRITGCNRESGVSFPDIKKLALAYEIPVEEINMKNILYKIHEVLNAKGPIVCEVCLEDDYIFMPKLSSEKKEDGTMISKPLEDMYPFLDREEFKNNIIK